jgi:hypothetical protein
VAASAPEYMPASMHGTDSSGRSAEIRALAERVIFAAKDRSLRTVRRKSTRSGDVLGRAGGLQAESRRGSPTGHADRVVVPVRCRPASSVR